MSEKTMEAPAIIIDEELRNLLPVLSAETYSLLEGSLLEYGCMHPLTVWNNILIDGHHRYEIATKHSIPFSVVSKEFNNRDDVIIWIIMTQIARRNLNSKQLSYYRGRHYRTEKKSNGDPSRFKQQLPGAQNEHLQIKTAKRLGDYYKVSVNTIRRDEQYADAVDAIGETSPEAKRSILAGETEITRKHLRELVAGADGKIADTARLIEEGTFEKPKPASPKLPDASNGTSPGPNPEIDPPDAGVHPLIASIIKSSEDFVFALRGLSFDSDKEEIEKRLRSHIDDLDGALEQLYTAPF